MVKLQKKKNRPVVCFPAEIEKEKCTGKLYGYFVEDTNYYNITSFIDNDVNRKQAEIGEVFEHKPTNITVDKLTGYYENDVLCFIDAESIICKKEPYSLKLDVFSRNTGILESNIMLKTGAMLIGCGSVGSLVALELAKAGVGRFLLIDNDILGYHNICRHQCGIYDVGKYKTEAVKERILQINPTAKVVTQNMIVQEVPLSVFDEFCDKDTIVIGGADNREGDLYVNQIAKEIGMPMMSIGCWERAFAGEIFYCLPDIMPDYSDFIWAIGDTSGRATQNRKFYTNEEDLAKAAFEPGISADIDFVTIIAVKLALDILNRNNPKHTPRLLGHLSQYTLVCNTNNPKIGGDNAEIFSYPLQVTTSIEVPYAAKMKSNTINV
jgi:molybdopterin/thiamine biosynthesis adenylyltransferase